MRNGRLSGISKSILMALRGSNVLAKLRPDGAYQGLVPEADLAAIRLALLQLRGVDPVLCRGHNASIVVTDEPADQPAGSGSQVLVTSGSTVLPRLTGICRLPPEASSPYAPLYIAIMRTVSATEWKPIHGK